MKTTDNPPKLSFQKAVITRLLEEDKKMWQKERGKNAATNPTESCVACITIEPVEQCQSGSCMC